MYQEALQLIQSFRPGIQNNISLLQQCLVITAVEGELSGAVTVCLILVTVSNSIKGKNSTLYSISEHINLPLRIVQTYLKYVFFQPAWCLPRFRYNLTFKN